MNTASPRRLVIGISGASGVICGIRALQVLAATDIETHLVLTKAAEMTIGYETDMKAKDVRALATHNHPIADVGAAISSGSYRTMGMLILPCSIRTMSEIVSGVTGSLITRAADVVLKERRRLVVAVRETPLHAQHLRNMAALSDLGAVIAPIMPAFYAKPKTIDEMIDHTVGRLLDHFDIEIGLVRRWGEDDGVT